MKNIILGFIICLVVISCETPLRIVETYSTDSNGKTVKTVQKYYDSAGQRVYAPQVSFNVVTSPFWYGGVYNPYYYGPNYYNPRIIVPVIPFYRGNGYRGGHRH